MKRIIITVVSLLLLAGCTTQRKAEKWYRGNPVELAKLCLDCFGDNSTPVYVKGRTDTIPGETIYIKGDSIPCPDGTKIKAPDVKVPCPPATQRVDTAFRDRWETLARIKVLEAEVAESKDELEKEKARGDKLQARGDKYKKSTTILSAIIGLGFLILIIRKWR